MGATILERLKRGTVLGDGGYLLELERRGVTRAGPFTPEATLENPGAVLELHREFLLAGAEVLQVFTFYGSREKLATVGYADRVEQLNRSAVRLAREAAGGRALVAADLSPTWTWSESPDRARRALEEQIGWQIDEGVDFIIGETFFHLGEARLCLERAKALSGLPVMITMAYRGEARSEDGATVAECMKTLAGEGADIVGVNCMRDPDRTYPLIEEARGATGAFLAAQPVAYRCTDAAPYFSATPAFPHALDPLQLTRREMGEFALRARDMGVNFIGGCCGTVAAHLREMARALGKSPDEDGAWRPDYGRPMSETERSRAERGART